jgi:phosphatidylglycerol:prolipoprotein diacylglycerol transferase
LALAARPAFIAVHSDAAHPSCILTGESDLHLSMIPFLHLGPLTIPTFGLMVATGLLVAAYILQADFSRRRRQLERYRSPVQARDEGLLARLIGHSHEDRGFVVIGIAGIVGLIGARFYHVLESPAEFFANPWPQLFSRFGFAWFGGFLGGVVALIFLARHFGIPLLEFLDICSPAAAVGYGIGRIGCLLSGDGDYGIPTTLPWGMSFPNGVVPTTQRVHPTPVYEFFIWLAIGALLWRLGKRALSGAGRRGEVFCFYLILTGVARFLIEFIRINPRSFFGLSNAQTASLVSILIGGILLWRIESGAAPKSETA